MVSVLVVHFVCLRQCFFDPLVDQDLGGFVLQHFLHCANITKSKLEFIQMAEKLTMSCGWLKFYIQFLTDKNFLNNVLRIIRVFVHAFFRLQVYLFESLRKLFIISSTFCMRHT